MYILGLILCSTYFFTLIPITIIQQSVGSTLREAQSVQRHKDAVIHELGTIAWRLREHTILPARFGGGEGDIRSFDPQSAIKDDAQASYVMEWDNDQAVIVAQSKMFDNATIRVMMNGSGRIGSWSYTGKFQ